MLDLWQGYRDKMQEARVSALLLSIVDRLFQYPAVTNPGVARELGITPRAAQLNIEKLMAAGILREVTGQKGNRLYVAGEVLRTLEESEGEG